MTHKSADSSAEVLPISAEAVAEATSSSPDLLSAPDQRQVAGMRQATAQQFSWVRAAASSAPARVVAPTTPPAPVPPVEASGEQPAVLPAPAREVNRYSTRRPEPAPTPPTQGFFSRMTSGLRGLFTSGEPAIVDPYVLAQKHQGLRKEREKIGPVVASISNWDSNSILAAIQSKCPKLNIGFDGKFNNRLFGILGEPWLQKMMKRDDVLRAQVTELRYRAQHVKSALHHRGVPQHRVDQGRLVN